MLPHCALEGGCCCPNEAWCIWDAIPLPTSPLPVRINPVPLPPAGSSEGKLRASSGH